MTRHMKRTIVISGILVLVLALVACAPLPAEVTPAPGEQAPAPEQPAEVSERAQTMNIAIGGRIADPTNLNLYAPGVSRSGTGLHQMIYEYFFYQNLQTGEYVPWLAESYEYNDDFSQITVQLRDGVTWSDGEVFNADDVVFTYNTLLENQGMIWASEVASWVESVEALDGLTVRFNLNRPSPRFHLNREAFPAVGIWGGITILPEHVWQDVDPLTFKNSPPIGTGPYVLDNATESAMSYVRDDDWWGTDVFGVTPPARYVNFRHVGPETNVALALAADELDTPNIGLLSLGSFLEVQRRNPDVIAWSDEAPYAWLDPCPRAMMVQNATEPWDQADARWALSYLINRDQIVELAYEGTTVPSWGIWPYYDGLQPFFDAIEDLRAEYPTTAYDPAMAAELFSNVGYEKGDDGYFVSADGETLTVNMIANADSTEAMKVAQVLADQLNAEGIEVEMQPLSGGVRDTALLRGEYDIYPAQSFCPGYIFDNLELFHSKYYEPLGELAPWYERNSFRYQNEEFDAIVDEMAVTPPDNQDKMIELYQQAMEIWFQDLPVIPMNQAPALVPFNTKYWEGWPTESNPWNMPVSWWATFDLVLNGYQSPDTGEWVGGIQPAGQ